MKQLEEKSAKSRTVTTEQLLTHALGGIRALVHQKSETITGAAGKLTSLCWVSDDYEAVVRVTRITVLSL